MDRRLGSASDRSASERQLLAQRRARGTIQMAGNVASQSARLMRAKLGPYPALGNPVQPPNGPRVPVTEAPLAEAITAKQGTIRRTAPRHDATTAATRVLASRETSHKRGTRLRRPGVGMIRIVGCGHSALAPKNPGVTWQGPGTACAMRSVSPAVNATVTMGMNTIHNRGRYQPRAGADGVIRVAGESKALLRRLCRNSVERPDRSL